MARYIGPQLKRCRQLGTVLPGITTVATLDRPFPPGDHGASRRNKPSDFKVRMMEKQKARVHFGILERQFRRYVEHASRMKGAAGTNLVLLLESRLDSIVWRMGFARTITAARQMVVHGHVIVNGIRVDRPSFHVAPGSLVTIKEKSKAKPFLADIVGGTVGRARPSWIEFDPATLTGKLISSPDRSDLPFELNENAIIEYYSQQL